MHRIDTDGNVSNLFNEGDPAVPRNPTQVDKHWLNAVQEEICSVISDSNITPITLTKGTNTQLRLAINWIAAFQALLKLGSIGTGECRFTPGTAPGSPSAGQVYFDSGTNKLRVYTGSAWADLH